MIDVSVLIVDDDPNSRDILTKFLEHYGMQVESVPSGEDALAVLNHKSYTFVVIDLALPGMDGWELQQRIPNPAATLAVAVTGYYTPLLAKEAKEAGFAAAFPKPITQSLVTSLQRLL